MILKLLRNTYSEALVSFFGCGAKEKGDEHKWN